VVLKIQDCLRYPSCFFPWHTEHGKRKAFGALPADAGEAHEGFNHPAEGLA
jgi:hypothetical protein